MLDFTIQSLERRIGKMTGEQNVEQCEFMENKINELTKELNERNNTVNLLTNQLKNLSRELHRIKREHELLYNKNDLLHNQLNTNELEMDIMLKEKEKETCNLQKLLIEKNLKKLQVNKLTKIYEQYTNKRYDLQKANCELNSTIKERTEQINLHQIMLNKQIKINTTENSQLNIEIQERKSKAAQDKELLQRKGDILDNEIRILEQEIVALENTLALMNGCNTTMQESSIRLDNDIELYKDQTKRLEIEVEHRMNEIEKQNTRLKRAYERMEKAKRLARLTKELVTHTTNELLNRIKGDLTIYEQARAMLSTSGIPVNNLAISGIQQRRISNLSSSTKSLLSSRSSRTTPTPISSNPTSPDSSTKCSSKLCSPRSDSICDDDNNDGGGNDKCDNVQNSSRT
ncbi:uncharacterized protein DC041_0001122, partial [Schistosoma bovis]